MFEIFKDKTGEFRFRLKSKNGEIILASESYKVKSNCIKGIESVKKNAQIKERFVLKESASGKWSFSLKASNGQVIGTSESYNTKDGAEKGILSVTKNAPEATIKEV